MPSLPSALALGSIGTNSLIVASDLRNNFAAVQTEMNALLAVLAGGAAGQAVGGVGQTLTWGGQPAIFDSMLGGDAATIDITSIPAFRHLRLVVQGRSSAAAITDSVGLRFNNDTGANYDYEILRGGAAVVVGQEAFAQTFAYIGSVAGNTAPAGADGSSVVTINDAQGVTFHKVTSTISSCKTGTTTGTLQTDRIGGFWRSAAAVNRITLILTSGGNFKAGTRCTLYGTD
jgi:hypothetical protein